MTKLAIPPFLRQEDGPTHHATPAMHQAAAAYITETNRLVESAESMIASGCDIGLALKLVSTNQDIAWKALLLECHDDTSLAAILVYQYRHDQWHEHQEVRM